MSIQKIIAALGLASLCVYAHAGMMTSTAVGTLNRSELGFASEFGPATYTGGPLVGMTYRLAISFDDAGGTYNSDPFSGQIFQSGKPVTVSMTVNNMTHLTTMFGQAGAGLDNALSGGVQNGDDTMYALAYLLDYSDGTRLETTMRLYSLINSFVGASSDPRANMTRSLSGEEDAAWMYYAWSNTDGNTVGLYGTVSSLSFEYTADAVVPAAVPEPGTMAVFGIGLVAFAASRRRAITNRARKLWPSAIK